MKLLLAIAIGLVTSNLAHSRTFQCHSQVGEQVLLRLEFLDNLETIEINPEIASSEGLSVGAAKSTYLAQERINVVTQYVERRGPSFSLDLHCDNGACKSPSQNFELRDFMDKRHQPNLALAKASIGTRNGLNFMLRLSKNAGGHRWSANAEMPFDHKVHELRLSVSVYEDLGIMFGFEHEIESAEWTVHCARI